MRTWIATAALTAWAATAFCVLGEDPKEMVEPQSPRVATKSFLAALTPENRKSAAFSFEDEERQVWAYVPQARKGLPLRSMADSERTAARVLLRSMMSNANSWLCRSIIALEDVLHEIEEKAGQDATHRDPTLYYFSVFGEPNEGETAKPYGVRIEGHHLSLHFTLRGDEFLSRTPLFLGANPGDRGTLWSQEAPVLHDVRGSIETLIDSLSPANRAKAKLSDDPGSDVRFGPGNAVTEPAEGLEIRVEKPADSVYYDVVRTAAGVTIADPIDEDGTRLARGTPPPWKPTRLAYAGSTKPGAGLYVRITYSDHVVIEYCNVQNNANHIHVLVRDQDDDFAARALHEHVKSEQGK